MATSTAAHDDFLLSSVYNGVFLPLLNDFLGDYRKKTHRDAFSSAAAARIRLDPAGLTRLSNGDRVTGAVLNPVTGGVIMLVEGKEWIAA